LEEEEEEGGGAPNRKVNYEKLEIILLGNRYVFYNMSTPFQTTGKKKREKNWVKHFS